MTHPFGEPVPLADQMIADLDGYAPPFMSGADTAAYEPVPALPVEPVGETPGEPDADDVLLALLQPRLDESDAEWAIDIVRGLGWSPGSCATELLVEGSQLAQIVDEQLEVIADIVRTIREDREGGSGSPSDGSKLTVLGQVSERARDIEAEQAATRHIDGTGRPGDRGLSDWEHRVVTDLRANGLDTWRDELLDATYAVYAEPDWPQLRDKLLTAAGAIVNWILDADRR